MAIVVTILLVARHFPEAARQLEESSSVGRESMRDVFKRWLLKARGGVWAFWRFVLEGKGLRDPKGSKFRMRQLLEQNRVLKSKVSGRAKITASRNTASAVPSVASTSPEAGDAMATAVAVNGPAVAVTSELVQPLRKQPVARVVSVSQPRKAPKVVSRRNAPMTPINPDEVMRQAKTFIDTKEFLRARHELERVMDSFQENPIFWARLGYVQYHLGAYVEAVRCYQKSLALDSNQANRYYNLALAYEAAQEHAESLAALDQALALDPSNVKYKQTRDALKTI